MPRAAAGETGFTAGETGFRAGEIGFCGIISFAPKSWKNELLVRERIHVIQAAAGISGKHHRISAAGTLAAVKGFPAARGQLEGATAAPGQRAERPWLRRP